MNVEPSRVTDEHKSITQLVKQGRMSKYATISIFLWFSLYCKIYHVRWTSNEWMQMPIAIFWITTIKKSNPLFNLFFNQFQSHWFGGSLVGLGSSWRVCLISSFLRSLSLWWLFQGTYPCNYTACKRKLPS